MLKTDNFWKIYANALKSKFLEKTPKTYKKFRPPRPGQLAAQLSALP